MEQPTKERPLIKGRLRPSSSKAFAEVTSYSMASAGSGIVMKERPDQKDDKKGKM